MRCSTRFAFFLQGGHWLLIQNLSAGIRREERRPCERVSCPARCHGSRSLLVASSFVGSSIECRSSLRSLLISQRLLVQVPIQSPNCDCRRMTGQKAPQYLLLFCSSVSLNPMHVGSGTEESCERTEEEASWTTGLAASQTVKEREREREIEEGGKGEKWEPRYGRLLLRTKRVVAFVVKKSPVIEQKPVSI